MTELEQPGAFALMASRDLPQRLGRPTRTAVLPRQAIDAVKAIFDKDRVQGRRSKKPVGHLAAPLAKGAIIVLAGKDRHGRPITARYAIN